MATASSGARTTVKNMNTRISRDLFNSETITGRFANAVLQVRDSLQARVIYIHDMWSVAGDGVAILRNIKRHVDTLRPPRSDGT